MSNRVNPSEVRHQVLDTRELVGAYEIAERLGWSTSAVANWSVRYDDFPKPAVWRHCGRLWRWIDVRGWAVRTGRMPIDDG